jgi:transposase
MPLATLVVPGNRADDGLYVPAISQSREVLGRRGVLYIGDSKMEAFAT